MIIGTKNTNFDIIYNNTNLNRKDEIKVLGLIIDKNLSFEKHLNIMSNKVSKIVSLFSRIRHYIPLFSLKLLYNALILPHFSYASCVWGHTYDKHKDRLTKLQKKLSRIVLFTDYRTDSD